MRRLTIRKLSIAAAALCLALPLGAVADDFGARFSGASPMALDRNDAPMMVADQQAAEALGAMEPAAGDVLDDAAQPSAMGKSAMPSDVIVGSEGRKLSDAQVNAVLRDDLGP